jgi:hypothetical protein
MAGVFYPTGTRGTAAQMNRVAKVQACELDTTQDAVAGKQPHLLTLTKRKVNVMDLLEVSSHSSWVTAVGALTNAKHRALFQASSFERLRLRYLAYSQDKATLQILHDALP